MAALRHLQLSQSREHCLNCQFWALSRMSFKMPKRQLFCKISPFEFGQEQKWPFSTSQKNDKNHVFYLWLLLQKSSLQNQKSTFTVKFSPCLSLEVPFLVLSRFQGWAAAFCSSASWPCHQFQHYNCIACWEIARIFDRVRSFPHFFHVYTKSTATPTYHRNSAHVAISSGRKFQNML